MKIRVLLIYPHLHNKEFMHARIPPIGLEYIAAYIRDFADVRILDYRFEKNVKQTVRGFEPDVIGISVLNCVRAHDAYEVASMCREAGSEMIVAGGLHATTCPEEVLDKDFDVVVRGEGEAIFSELVKSGGLKGVQGISYKGAGKIIHEADAPLIEDIDTLPLPARDLRNPNANYSFNFGLMKADIMATSRGCTGNCDFCSPAVYYGGRWRAHSPERVIEDLQTISAPWMMLSDDHFMGDIDRIDRICDLIISKGIKKEFFFQTRMVPGREELKRKMVKAGFRMLSFGVEGISQETVDRYGKGMNTKELRKFVHGWRDAGATFINGSFVFAHPDDSRETLLSFGDFARDIDLDFADFIFLTPYPGTRIYNEYDQKGLVLSKDWKRYTQGTLLVKHPQLDDREMRNAKRLAFMRFMSPLKLSRTLGLITDYFAEGKNESGLKSAIAGLYIGYLNRHLLFGNHYEASAFHDLPEYEGRELSRIEMLRIYFGEQMDKFPEAERDMTEGFDHFLQSIRTGPMNKLMRRINLCVSIKDGRKTLTKLHIKIRNGRIKTAVFDSNAPGEGLIIPIDIKNFPVTEDETFFTNIKSPLGNTLSRIIRF